MYEGGCHCGEIRFRVQTQKRVVLDCDCSMCSKKGLLHLIVDKNELEILSDDALLSEYRFGTRTARHLFCSSCGIHPFYVPRSHPDGYSVNFRCLDDYPRLLEQFDVKGFHGEEWEANVDSIR